MLRINPNISSGNVVLYLSKREYISSGKKLEDIRGVAFIPNKDKLKGKVLYASLTVMFRYGREEDETMGLSMSKEVNMDRVLVYPTKKDVDKDALQVCGYH